MKLRHYYTMLSLELRRWALSFRKSLPVLKQIAQSLSRTRAAPRGALAVEKTMDYGSLDKMTSPLTIVDLQHHAAEGDDFSANILQSEDKDTAEFYSFYSCRH